MKPTQEQQDGIDAFKGGSNITLEAGAGTGKTTECVLMSKTARPTQTGIYLAFNRAIANEGKAKFSSNVECRTIHSFAFKSHGLPYKQAAHVLGIREVFHLAKGMVLQPSALASMAIGTVVNYCHSDDDDLNIFHVPYRNGMEHADEATKAALRAFVLDFAIKAWDELQGIRGKLKFTPDHFLKMWALDRPDFEETHGADFIFLDEAQDTNPVTNKVFLDQSIQKIAVGDRSQAIYGWRGAKGDVMDTFKADHHLFLTQSFRFGPAVAHEANKWLSLIDAPLRLTGFDQIDSRLAHIDNPDAILCRTNAGVIAEAIQAIDAGIKVAVVNGTDEIKRMAEAAQELQHGKGCSHPELAAFQSWSDVQTYVNEENVTDLRVFVNLIDNYGAEEVIRIAQQAAGNEKYADLILSTAHKAKGREWGKVKVGSDFQAPKDDAEDEGEISKDEAMLSYVTVTRAQRELDRGPLEWIDRKTLGNVHNLPVEEEVA
jgi:hypothetical protein